MKKIGKNNYNLGITLVALVITIIVLLILSGIIIKFAIGENGLINRFEYAKKEHENAQDDEKNGLDNCYSRFKR